ncbi:unnamed protein product [Didymodactylos carnosus]|uniref:Uncharacterized protein n=1 Tax=Didymodactylos carnosus TaxID=1234261 RepID=A0A8S2EBF6_9BILA|nr:unnamed protein product [Didymodactylos carnosus]CAF3992595.1 unnamed protein product [Didymodactylos carnosus]
MSATDEINNKSDLNKNKKPDLPRFYVAKGKYSSRLNKEQQQQQQESNNSNNNSFGNFSSNQTAKLNNIKPAQQQSAKNKISNEQRQSSYNHKNPGNYSYGSHYDNYTHSNNNADYYGDYNQRSYHERYQNDYYDSYYDYHNENYQKQQPQQQQRRPHTAKGHDNMTHNPPHDKNKQNVNNKKNLANNRNTTVSTTKQLTSSLTELNHREECIPKKSDNKFNEKTGEEIKRESTSDNQIEDALNNEKLSQSPVLDLEDRIISMTFENKRLLEMTPSPPLSTTKQDNNERTNDTSISQSQISDQKQKSTHDDRINEVLEASSAGDVLKLSNSHHRGILFINKDEKIASNHVEKSDDNKNVHQTVSDQTLSRSSQNETLKQQQYYNQNRKHQQHHQNEKKLSTQQSIRGLTNITRKLYDPNAPLDHIVKSSSIHSFDTDTPPVRSKQTFQKIPANPLLLSNVQQLQHHPPPPQSAPPTLSTLKQMQEFYQHYQSILRRKLNYSSQFR